MVDRLRALLDRPLDPRAGRAIVALATAMALGLPGLVVLAGGTDQVSRSAPAFDRGAAQVHSAFNSGAGALLVEARPSSSGKTHRRQDPQDDRGSAAARHAGRALKSHRALQHVPYHHGGLSVVLVGARHGRAVLLTRAATLPAAHRGLRRFLNRYHDSGSAYLSHFVARKSRHG